MAVYVEVVQSKNDSPVKGAKVVLKYENSISEEAVTDERGVAEFGKGGMVTLFVNGQMHQSQIEIDDEETVTIALNKSRIAKLRLFKKVHLHSVNSNPILPANQPNQRQAALHIQAPMGKLKRQRSTFNISLVIDCSSSMIGDKIYYATEAAIQILKWLNEDDRVSVVTFSGASQVILPGRQLNDQTRDSVIEQLRQPVLGEQSSLSEGWQAGVGQVLDHKKKDTLNWVILFSDGQIDAGITGEDELRAKAQEFRQQGVNTYTLGVGDDVEQSLLRAIVEAGEGEFHFIDQPDELPNTLTKSLKRFGALMQIGHKATIELTVPGDIQVTALQTVSYSRQGPRFNISLGEIYARQQENISLMLQLPPYPAGQQITLPAALHYHDAQALLPVTVRAMPISFTVVDSVREEPPEASDTVRLAPPPSQPASRSWINPVFAVLSGGALFLLTALLAVGTLLLLSPKNEPVDTANPPPPLEADVKEEVAVVQPTGTITLETPTQTPLPVTETVTVVTIGSDVLNLPTQTPTPRSAPTSTATYTPIPQPTSPVKPVEGLQVGNLAPDFTLGSTRATRVSLSELRGKIVILNFWTTWCGYCAVEVPALESIHNEYGPQGVVVLAINQGESLQTVERYAWDHGIHFTVWLDEDAWAGNIYQVRGIPTTYYIDREGVIRAVFRGTRTYEQFVAQLEELL